MTMRFLAGLTKLANIPPDITMGTKLNYFHFLFEAKDISMTTRTLGSDEMSVSSHYSWTPLDYYVTGHAISHSNCSWRVYFMSSSIDDEKFELCGIMCYYVMSCNYFLSVTIYVLYNYVQFSWSSVAHRVVSPVDCSLNNNIWPRYKC